MFIDILLSEIRRKEKHMKRIRMGAIGILLSLILFTLPAQADQISNPGDFPADTTVLTFEGLTPGLPVTTQYSGATFSGYNIVMALSQNSQVLSVTGQLIVTFDPNVKVNMVGLDVDLWTTITLEAYGLGGKDLGSASISNDGFLGLSSGEMISYVIIHDGGGTFAIDNFRFADPVDGVPVPEPSTLILLGSGLVGLGFLGRKKFRAKG
jgi:hypothetical protein